MLPKQVLFCSFTCVHVSIQLLRSLYTFRTAEKATIVSTERVNEVICWCMFYFYFFRFIEWKKSNYFNWFFGNKIIQQIVTKHAKEMLTHCS